MAPWQLYNTRLSDLIPLTWRTFFFVVVCEGCLLTTGVMPPYEAKADPLLFASRNGTPATATASACGNK